MASTSIQSGSGLGTRFVITLLYLLSVSVISYTLLTEHHTAVQYYYAYPALMLIALISRHRWTKRLAAMGSIAVIVVGSYFEPLTLDAIEESFLLIPLTYLVLFPGSLWPFVSAILLIGSYLQYQKIGTPPFYQFTEDAVELAAIAFFATVGVYYKQKLQRQLERYRRDSYTDFLTKLANRKAFTRDTKALERQRDTETHYALLQLDIDDFKLINDSLGHQQGDKLLFELAKRLKGLDFSRVDLYRMSGDEFAIILKDQYDIRFYADQVAHYILDACSQGFKLDNRSYHMTMSIGIALFEDAMHDSDIWCRNVDIAVLRAKQKGNNIIQHFDEELIGETIRNYQLERELSNAIEKQQLTLNYQPKVDIKTGEVHSAEALIRWHHPDLGLISPEEFVGLAEKSQQIIPIGRWVIETACKQAKAWQITGHNICIAVNVSTVQFLYDDIFNVVTKALRETHLDPKLLQLEITETTLMQQPQNVSETCQDLRTLGIRIAIDDFGVAYSSLNYLSQLPIDVLKIDKSFVDNCVNNHDDHMLVRTIIQLGHNMGKVVTAEGVNNHNQLHLLAIEGCDEYQGYYYSKPLPAKAFIERIEQMDYPEPTRLLAQ
ncbi:putative bifunctional diguanylate cyclase/phosphodiesterase [Vibrio furnissii]|uniref:putative bifunctional diguanylate cyclase/phosphodiesterase n=1 Tax=Vibrio furnissii TaxID=29494 RepID=UPI0013024A9D|nr:bifunctional diguanylate cyclase/phosphodiesterase [Vibrio furnissii]